jgi:molybdopterin converting factor small subunit
MLVQFYAGAADAAGVQSYEVDAVATVAQLRDRLVSDFPALTDVLPRCSLLVDGTVATGETALAGTKVDVLPPFAGG